MPSFPPVTGSGLAPVEDGVTEVVEHTEPRRWTQNLYNADSGPTLGPQGHWAQAFLADSEP